MKNKLMTSTLSKLSTDQILKSYAFPHKFYVKFAVIAAEKALTYIKEPNPESLRAVDLAKRFSQGEDIPPKDLKDATQAARAASRAVNWSDYVHSAASSAAACAAHAASGAHAACAAASASYAAFARDAATSATYAGDHAAAACASTTHAAREEKACTEYLKKALIDLIRKELSEFELIMLGVEI